MTRAKKVTVIAPGCVFLTEPLQGMLQTPCSHRELSLLKGCSGTGMVKAHRSSLAGWVVALQTLVGTLHTSEAHVLGGSGGLVLGGGETWAFPEGIPAHLAVLLLPLVRAWYLSEFSCRPKLLSANPCQPLLPLSSLRQQQGRGHLLPLIFGPAAWGKVPCLPWFA